MKITHIDDYAPLRKAEYPPLSEFADAMYWSVNGNPIPLQQYYAKIEAVKLKYPKLIGT